MQHREIEQKLADARLAQSNAILKEEQERSKKEKEVVRLFYRTEKTMMCFYQSS